MRFCTSILIAFFGFCCGTNTHAQLTDGPWKYSFNKPSANWAQPDFNDQTWKEGFGGFGTPGTPESRVNTRWNKNDIWLRRQVEIKKLPSRPGLLIHHDEDTEVFLNGKKIASFEGYSTEYSVHPLTENAKAVLKQGNNLLAVHCRQTQGGQYIDVHIVDADNVPKLPKVTRSTTPFETELETQWGSKVNPGNAWTEYPRPALRRNSWVNLNGNWDYQVTPIEQRFCPTKWKGKILVPYCLESKLSGVQRLLDPSEALWYSRTFDASPRNKERVILNFEAVDYYCRVWVNDIPVGEHTGGNTPFSFDITDALINGDNELVVRVEDETEGSQLRGKQVLNPQGIWYTQVSGIWQTVWMEQVPERRIADVKISTDVNDGSISVEPILFGPASKDEKVRLIVKAPGSSESSTLVDGKLTVKVTNPILWSPANPNLYELYVELADSDNNVIDKVESYTGIRSVGKIKDKNGHWRFTLNGKVIFHWGPLDQGWWPDGLLTPPSDQAMLYDIEYLKEAGFNMIRKHIKVEPRRYYYHCDRMGMMVWQDQVSGGSSPPWTRMQANPTDSNWRIPDHRQYMREFEDMVDSLGNHPSIVVWTPFNEAWGQHDTVKVAQWISKRDPSRLINIASGGNFWPIGDIADHHAYPHPNFPVADKRFSGFIKVVGEFGGHGYPIKEHLWDPDARNWGYGDLPKTKEEYVDRYVESINRLNTLRKEGIAGGVYTQTTDVEGEINGLLSYDRKVIKIPAKELARIHQQLFTHGTNAVK